MKIKEITVKNFRLLEEVSLCLEDDTTLIVGRNNCGKTSLTELFRRLLADGSPKFRLEDFSLGIHGRFLEARELVRTNVEESVIRERLPAISISVDIQYSADEDLGTLSDFIVDLNEACTTARIVVTYAVLPGKINDLLADLGDEPQTFFRELRERVPKLYEARIEAHDPNDPTNIKVLESPILRAVLQFGFINAQRALDEASNKEKAVLGKIFERLFTSATAPTAGQADQARADALKVAVEEVQNEIDTSFNRQLQALAPTFDLFGYPGLSDPQLRTETQLEVQQLLSNHTTVTYSGPIPDGVNLPESYNGLGLRNLIFILLKLFELFREFTSRQPQSGVHLIFIEEPEAHLHPQMQSVFIRQLNKVRAMFEAEYNGGAEWPVQFVVTTHSSHIANEASFDAMRYFLSRPREAGSNILTTRSKDLRIGLSEEEPENRKFLHQYMTLTRCDLLFADGAIFVEGTTERLILPTAIGKFDQQNGSNLGGKYLSIMEVGGAYAHLFYALVDFLDLRTLIITDLDSIDAGDNRKKCKVSEGTHSSNASVNRWFDPDGGNSPALEALLAKTRDDKAIGSRRIAYQIPHEDGGACGRSFEDAFMLANPIKFDVNGATVQEMEAQVWELAQDIKKSEFALKFAINEKDWVIPRYIDEGLRWLGKINDAVPENAAIQPLPEEQADA
ncbi:MAG: ATP-dependent endonuclease [Opitutales bacterium]|nr:ATP-dependent endonuclease [Opitutales bacterium]